VYKYLIHLINKKIDPLLEYLILNNLKIIHLYLEQIFQIDLISPHQKELFQDIYRNSNQIIHNYNYQFLTKHMNCNKGINIKVNIGYFQHLNKIHPSILNKIQRNQMK
jgi:hypothetical protein